MRSTLCACGCNEPITAASPSPWYASAACAWRWAQRHANNPLGYGRDVITDNRETAAVWADTPQRLPVRVAVEPMATRSRRLFWGWWR